MSIIRIAGIFRGVVKAGGRQLAGLSLRSQNIDLEQIEARCFAVRCECSECSEPMPGGKNYLEQDSMSR